MVLFLTTVSLDPIQRKPPSPSQNWNPSTLPHPLGAKKIPPLPSGHMKLPLPCRRAGRAIVRSGNTSWRFPWQTFERTTTIWTSTLSPGWEKAMRPDIPPMLADMKARGLAVESNGALIFPVAEEGDKKEMPPCILVKSDGATLYDTTDLATLVQRGGISTRIRSFTWRTSGKVCISSRCSGQPGRPASSVQKQNWNSWDLVP